MTTKVEVTFTGHVPADPVEPGSPRRNGAVRPQRQCPETVRVMYNDTELRAIAEAASGAGLTISGFLAAAGLAFAGACVSPPTSADHALLRESLRLGSGLADTIAMLRQAIAAASPPGVAAPSSLLIAIHHCEQTAGQVDELASRLSQRLS